LSSYRYFKIGKLYQTELFNHLINYSQFSHLIAYMHLNGMYDH